ncbi:chaoptin-like [Contarinia nasturtii]|uniref:chaoptin-like n=1 Tax=Contarinia nasturtii TaxID=265458 RepID=UPI0012D3866E|nr:chaoptin-like [Contarinia nasturtii]
MKYSIVSVFALINVFCEGRDFECGYFQDGIESIGYHCASFDEELPVDCSSNFFYLLNDSNKSKVTHLKVNGCDCVSVKKVAENFPNLKSLDISHSKIESVELFNMKHLVKINAAHNRLTEIPSHFFSKLPNITELDLSHNRLTKIDKLPTNLVNIDLSHNHIKNLFTRTYEDLLNLEHLDLSHNSIRSVDFFSFAENKKLKVLQLRNNEIADFDSTLARLVQRGVSVYISWDHISTFSLSEYRGDKIRVILKNNEKEGIIHKKPSGKVVLYCNAMSFKHIITVDIEGHNIENPTEMLQCFPPSIATMRISGTFAEKLDFSLLQRFSVLTSLSIKGTQLRNFDFATLKNCTKLQVLEMINTNLDRISNVAVFDNFKDLHRLNLEGNQILNIPQLIPHLSSNIWDLNLNGNFVGKLNASTFERLANIQSLFLRKTHLSFDDLKPFEPFDELKDLDISHNNLERTDFTASSTALEKLTSFWAARCKIAKMAELLKMLTNSFFWIIDISENTVGQLDDGKFGHFERIFQLNASKTSLSQVDIDLMNQFRVQILDLSHNNLKTMNFSSGFSDIHQLFVQENELTEMNGLLQTDIPWIWGLNISRNQFSCDYLKTFIPRLENKFTTFKMFGDPLVQKHTNCHPQAKVGYFESFWMRIRNIF